ncbi:MAG TPA: hypothetical protein VF808_16835 [Ktedonobacterales bacterium]
MTTASGVTARTPGAVTRSILIAGLLIGVLSSLDDVGYFTVVEHRDPSFIFQYIASALLGQAAFTGGAATTLLGALLHFGISFVVAAVFILAAIKLAFLRRGAILFGLLYALAVFLVMNALVVPLTLAPKLAVTLPLIINTIIGTLLAIGLPCGVIVWRTARKK